jgi:hypothetical protein
MNAASAPTGIALKTASTPAPASRQSGKPANARREQFRAKHPYRADLMTI